MGYSWIQAHRLTGQKCWHIYLVRFNVSQNHMLVGGLAQLIYMQVHNSLFYGCGIYFTGEVFPTSWIEFNLTNNGTMKVKLLSWIWLIVNVSI